MLAQLIGTRVSSEISETPKHIRRVTFPVSGIPTPPERGFGWSNFCVIQLPAVDLDHPLLEGFFELCVY